MQPSRDRVLSEAVRVRERFRRHSPPVLLGFALFWLAGCAADAVVVLDPILGATADSNGALTRRIDDVTRDRRVPVIHAATPAAEDLLVAIRSVGSVDRVIVPALLSGEIERLAPELPRVRFFLIDHALASDAGGGLVPVAFDRTPAFAEAGRYIAEWAVRHEEDSPGVLLLFSEENAMHLAERDALLDALGDPPAAVRIEGFPSRPNRDQIRDAVRWPQQSGPTLVGLFLSAANATAREVITASIIVTEGLPGGTSGVVATISNEFADGVVAALDADETTNEIAIPSRFVRFPGTESMQR